jgi:hypothetical protein
MKIITLKALRRTIRFFRRMGFITIIFSIFFGVAILNPETNITVDGFPITDPEARIELIGIPISLSLIGLCLILIPKHYWYRYFLIFKR